MNRRFCRAVARRLLGLSVILVSACEEPKQTKKVNAYSGPVEVINDVKLLYSEAAELKVKLSTPRQYRYENDNRTYPRPVSIDFYGPGGKIVTTLRSDSGRYDKAKDLYTVMGHVVVINKEKQEKLMTSVLNWTPTTKKVFTDQRVTVLSQLTGEKLYGIGLDANQDFSQYSIRKPTGVFNVEGGF